MKVCLTPTFIIEPKILGLGKSQLKITVKKGCYDSTPP